MRIAVATLCVGENFKKKMYHAHKSLIEYCKINGYDLITDESVIDHTRSIPWSKLLLIMKYLPNYDYIVWIDADAMILDQTQRLEDKIALMESYPLMVSQPDSTINTGVIFAKNVPETYTFIMTVYNQTKYVLNEYYGNFEQDAYQAVLNENIDDMAKYCLVLPFEQHTKIQSYLRFLQPDSFILHLAGFRGDELTWVVTQLFKQLYPLQLEDEDSERYIKRREWYKTNIVDAIPRFYNIGPFEIIGQPK